MSRDGAASPRDRCYDQAEPAPVSGSWRHPRW
ncbi:hypothetical protein PPL_00880 [Heterostelium album PN500]|uniref:Uncharacterized protein n=1 Tax=Heterostelium pallidum (strain ATCC 26659 / Pp 5 / PN500) TaxID=670386 RepID=D3AYW1_HETP5|nr:hypothetical protein PPL_00880 [Heterostelium album PN500]EFA85651.1 hypothetical protein PPL_00880 [Heterostelium album PN500]|eukprot:XP_020437758.1 hypothetical protein PPL_00880 [Heterostelium album PN500]